jgi:hypothetical protein
MHRRTAQARHGVLKKARDLVAAEQAPRVGWTKASLEQAVQGFCFELARALLAVVQDRLNDDGAPQRWCE